MLSNIIGAACVIMIAILIFPVVNDQVKMGIDKIKQSSSANVSNTDLEGSAAQVSVTLLNMMPYLFIFAVIVATIGVVSRMFSGSDGDASILSGVSNPKQDKGSSSPLTNLPKYVYEDNKTYKEKDFVKSRFD